MTFCACFICLPQLSWIPSSDKLYTDSAILTTGKRMSCANCKAGRMLALDSLSCHWHSCKRCFSFGYLAASTLAAQILETWTQDCDKEGKLYVHEPVLYIMWSFKFNYLKQTSKAKDDQGRCGSPCSPELSKMFRHLSFVFLFPPLNLELTNWQIFLRKRTSPGLRSQIKLSANPGACVSAVRVQAGHFSTPPIILFPLSKTEMVEMFQVALCIRDNVNKVPRAMPNLK